jgi:phage replication-related protein YjqB (UPF0714/DUF867 family)
MDMADKYKNFWEIASSLTLGRDFRVRLRNVGTNIAIIAPHGGGIEPGTSEIADAIAARELSFYAFEGIRSRRNGELHITSTRFDEPRCVTLLAASARAITIHGENSSDPVVYLGGRDREMLIRLRSALRRQGFCVKSHQSCNLRGRDPANICNRTSAGTGIQIELSKGLRRSFFRSLSKKGRCTKTPRFHEFVLRSETPSVGPAKTPQVMDGRRLLEADLRIYKYMSAERGRSVLSEGLIRYTPPEVFNDPFEMKPFYEQVVDYGKLATLIESPSVQASAEERITGVYRTLPAEFKERFPLSTVLAMLREISGDKAEAMLRTVLGPLDAHTRLFGAQINKSLNDAIGVLSLSATNDSLLMWAHYADNHRGLLIEFDSEHEYFNRRRGPDDEFRHLRKVAYTTQRPRVNLMRANSTDIFLTKSLEWQYEDEYRVLMPLEEADELRTQKGDPIHLFSIPPNCITGVILGARIDEYNKRELGRFLQSDDRYEHVLLSEAALNEEEFRLVIAPLDSFRAEDPGKMTPGIR